MGRYARERDTRRKETDAERSDRNDRKTRHRSGAPAPSRARFGGHRAARSRGGAGEEGRRRGARRPAGKGHLCRLPRHLLRHERAPARGGGRLGRGVVARGGSAVDRFGRRTRRTSGELASRIGRLRDSALDLTLSVGGDEGLGSAVTRGARFTWSLSRLTLPHRLARVVALEQLYRAFEILRGGPYHK